MLRLKETVVYKDLPYNIQSHLKAPVSRETKWGMACLSCWCWIFSAYYLCWRAKSNFHFAVLPVAILINVWMILINTRNMTEYLHHLQYVRFMGVSFSGMSYCQLITAQNDVSAIGFHLPLISLSLFIYAASIFLVIRYYLAVFPDPKEAKGDSSSDRDALAAVPAAGYMISHAVCEFQSLPSIC
ncbi:hypothetical protein PO124_30485 [Bacillus licheniformis]|nr:hypothetical protein [Bacillus licheniformis]